MLIIHIVLVDFSFGSKRTRRDLFAHDFSNGVADPNLEYLVHDGSVLSCLVLVSVTPGL